MCHIDITYQERVRLIMMLNLKIRWFEELKVALGDVVGEFDSLYYYKDGKSVNGGFSLLSVLL